MSGAAAEDLRQGLLHHETGRLEDAARVYCSVLSRDSSSADAWHLLGRVRLSMGDFESASGCIVKAIHLRPDLPAFHCALGDVLAAQGRVNDAELCYREALRLDGRFVAAWVNLGNVMQSAGRAQEACAAFARALDADPSSAEALNNLGNALLATGFARDGMACLREAVRLRPGLAEAPVNLAAAHLAEGEAAEAERWARLALEVRPGLTEALSNLSLALLKQARHSEAEIPARQAVSQMPNAAHLHSNLALVLLNQKRYEEAEQECRLALELRPGYPEATNNLAVVLQLTGRLEQSAEQLDALLRAHPRDASAWTNLGTARAAQARHDEALECFEEALRHNPKHAKAHFCHSLELLARGRWLEGFAEYEWRWKMANPAREVFGPSWDGDQMDGTVLVSAEQGLGDTIQFMRYLPFVAERVSRVVVESQPAAACLVRSMRGVAEVITAADALPDFAAHAWLMSLPRIFGTTPGTVPGRDAYLSSDGEGARAMEERMGPRRGVRVGLAWAGNPENAGDGRRSIPLVRFDGLQTLPGVEWFSLHHDNRARADVRDCGLWIREVLSERGGLRELAALVSCLDLVISVDTMAGHMAGAIGRPVWNLLCAAPDWRWGRAGESTPWYPSMRLFRQRAPGDWDDVLARVTRALRRRDIQGLASTTDTEE